MSPNFKAQGSELISENGYPRAPVMHNTRYPKITSVCNQFRNWMRKQMKGFSFICLFLVLRWDVTKPVWNYERANRPFISCHPQSAFDVWMHLCAQGWTGGHQRVFASKLCDGNLLLSDITALHPRVREGDTQDSFFIYRHTPNIE